MLQIRPRIYLEDQAEHTAIYSLPKGYDNTPDDVIRKIADTTFVPKHGDIIKAVLFERCCNVLLNGDYLTKEAIESRKEYFDYTGKEWKSPGFFNKRS